MNNNKTFLKIKNICCVGAGYVGGPTMALIASKCHDIKINVVDLNQERINQWNSDDLSNLPIYEPGLDLIIKKCRNKNLFFTTDVHKSIAEADMIFLAVNTPTKSKGIGAGQASDLKWIEASAKQVADHAVGTTIVVEKSTVPVRTAETIKQILNLSSNNINKNQKKLKKFSVLSNPEFLSEGSAIDDLENPDRILIGGEDLFAIESLANIYKRWVDDKKIIRTNLWSSELSKLTANAFLAQRLSSINSIAALCESTGADVNEVSKAIGLDSRIGEKFLQSGPGFGGSCFKKDILNLIYLCNFYGLNEVANYWKSVLDINSWTQDRISREIVFKLFGTVIGKKIAILGFSFKANTNDTRESPSIKICKNLIEEGACLSIYDPKVEKKQIESDLGLNCSNEVKISSWIFANNIFEAAKNADAIVILTEWHEFRYIEWEKIYKIMRKPSWLIDTRNIANYKKAESFGIKIWRIGIDK